MINPSVGRPSQHIPWAVALLGWACTGQSPAPDSESDALERSLAGPITSPDVITPVASTGRFLSPRDIDAHRVSGTIVMPGARLLLAVGPSGFQATAIDPGRLKLRSGPGDRPTVNFRDVLGSRVRLSEAFSADFYSDNNVSYGGDHSSAGFDPRFGGIFRTDAVPACNNATGASPPIVPRGTYECYKLLLYTPLLLRGQRVPHVAPATLALRSFDASGRRLTQPQIEHARIDQPWRRVKYRAANGRIQPMSVYEITVTADSRFMYFTRLDPRYQGFSFNPRPWDGNSYWTEPRPYAEMHRAGGETFCFSTRANASESQCNPDLRFTLGERYPILAKPLRMPDGSAFVSQRECAYSWISADGEELFCNMHNSAGVAVVGRRTGWVWYLIDSPINRARARRPKGCPPADRTRRGVCAGASFSQSLGVTSGTWRVPDELDPAELGILPTPESYLILTRMWGDSTQTRRAALGAVDLSMFSDRDYLANLPLNEMLTQEPYLNDNRPVHGLDLGRTPDLSGNFLTATLAGKVKFFYDSDSKPFDESQNYLKWKGSYLKFFNSGRVAVTPSQYSAANSLVRPLGSFTIELAIRWLGADGRYPPNTRAQVLAAPGAFALWLDESQQLQGSFNFGNTPHRIIPVSLAYANNAWVHVSLRYQRALGRIRLDLICPGCSAGNRRKAALLSLHQGGRPQRPTQRLSAGDGRLLIGPGRVAGDGSPAEALFDIDEVKLSKVYRSDEALRASVFEAATAGVINITSFPGFNPGSSHRGLDLAQARLSEQLEALTRQPQTYARLVCLGRSLFRDPKLSTAASGRGQGLSCASCHQPARYFSDGKQSGTGANGPTGLNTPVVFNRLFSGPQFFDRRSPSLFDQVLQPITSQAELGAKMKQVLAKLTRVRKADFETVFGPIAAVTREHLALALSGYLSALISGDSRVDRIAAGEVDTGANLASIARGAQLFHGKARCAGCHAGATFSDELLHDGAAGGRSVKTPTLRSVSETAPYFHDGSKATLAAVLKFYRRGGKRRSPGDDRVALDLEDRDLVDLERFLRALRSDPPEESVSCP